MLHGTEVHDPYRWLEDGDSEETTAWVAAQNARTRAVLDALPQRAPLHRRLLELLQIGVVGSPAVAGDRVFHLQREGDADQAVLVLRSAVDPDAPARVVVDPHGLAADHAASIDWFSPSPDGRLLAYGVSEGGSEHGTLRIVEVDTGTLLPDAIPHVRHPSLAWLPGRIGLRLRPPPRPGHRRPTARRATGSRCGGTGWATTPRPTIPSSSTASTRRPCPWPSSPTTDGGWRCTST